MLWYHLDTAQFNKNGELSFLLYLTTLSRLQKLYSVEFEDGCE
jgi:hypothetical protein